MGGKGRDREKKKSIRTAAAEQCQHRAPLAQAPPWAEANPTRGTTALPATPQSSNCPPGSARQCSAEPCSQAAAWLLLSEESGHQLEAPSRWQAGERLAGTALLVTVTLRATREAERMRRHKPAGSWACSEHPEREKCSKGSVLPWPLPRDPKLRCCLLQPCNLTATVWSLFQSTQLPGRSGCTLPSKWD